MIRRPRDVDLLQRRAFLGLVELGDLVLAHHAFEQRLLQLELAAGAHVVDRRLRDLPDRQVDRAAGLPPPWLDSIRASSARSARSSELRRITSGFCSVADVRSTFSCTSRSVIWARSSAAPVISASACLSRTMTPGLLLHRLQRLLGLDQVLLGVLQLLLEERAAQLRFRDREAAEHLGDLDVVRVGEIGGELRRPCRRPRR